jgi:hypothetical protein
MTSSIEHQGTDSDGDRGGRSAAEQEDGQQPAGQDRGDHHVGESGG